MKKTNLVLLDMPSSLHLPVAVVMTLEIIITLLFLYALFKAIKYVVKDVSRHKFLLLAALAATILTTSCKKEDAVRQVSYQPSAEAVAMTKEAGFEAGNIVPVSAASSVRTFKTRKEFYEWIKQVNIIGEADNVTRGPKMAAKWIVKHSYVESAFYNDDLATAHGSSGGGGANQVQPLTTNWGPFINMEVVVAYHFDAEGTLIADGVSAHMVGPGSLGIGWEANENKAVNVQNNNTVTWDMPGTTVYGVNVEGYAWGIKYPYTVRGSYNTSTKAAYIHYEPTNDKKTLN